jgi:tRNA(Ile)-lysidine synthase
MCAKRLSLSAAKPVVEMDNALPLSMEEARELIQPLTHYPRIALAVSGGPDSLALLHLAHQLRDGDALRPEIIVLTVDHGLRANSRDEAHVVGVLAAQLGFDHAILDWRPSEHPKAGLQQAAREARYGLMAEYCHAQNIPALVTAHQLEDQAETMLMRLARGSGLDGLAAIPERSHWAGLAILRPLLSVPKARLVATLRAAGIDWVEDPTNADTRYERARIRAAGEAMEALGLAPEALARSARRLARAREALDRTTENFLASHCVTSDAGYCTLNIEALLAAPEEIALRTLGSVIEVVGARNATLNLAKLESLLASIKQRPATSQTLGGCRLQLLERGLGVFREARRSSMPIVVLAPGGRTLWDNRFSVALAPDAPGPVTVKAVGEGLPKARRADFPWLASVPLQARVALPACWREGELLSIPRVLPNRGLGDAHGFSASFLGARWTGRNIA